jgi:hypothetical protein
MSSPAQAHAGYDLTDAAGVFRSSLKLGLLESAAVLLLGLASRFLAGSIETAVQAFLLVTGLLMVTALPGRWTRARTIEGIAGAAGIGLGATVVFLLIDVALFQPFGLYTHRWRDLGGGSNWWYHPIWWMVGTYLSWFGAWILANQTARHGAPSVAGLAIWSLGFAALCGAIGVVLHVPGAGWNLPTFGVAFLPGLALTTVASSMGSSRA